jgi:hypothetical protein
MTRQHDLNRRREKLWDVFLHYPVDHLAFYTVHAVDEAEAIAAARKLLGTDGELSVREVLPMMGRRRG